MLLFQKRGFFQKLFTDFVHVCSSCELRDRLDRLRMAEAQHQQHQEREQTLEEGLASSISWNVSVHTPAKVKQKFKKRAIKRPKVKRPVNKPKASSSGSVKNSDDSGKRWDEYSDELDLGLDLTDSIPLVIQGFNEVKQATTSF